MPPINDFTCKNCNHEFEYFSFGSEDKPVCPNCSSKKLEKQISKSTSFILKGKSWARDGYRNIRKKPRE